MPKFGNTFDQTTLTDKKYKELAFNTIGKFENTTKKYDPHFDGKNSISAGYGLDLLVQSESKIDSKIKSANLVLSNDIEELTDAQKKVLKNARAKRVDFLKIKKPTDQQKKTFTDAIKKAQKDLNWSIDETQAKGTP